MGQSATAILAFGIPLEEDQELPWSDKKYDDMEDWWRDIKGYKPPFEMFDSKGEWLPGFKDNKEKSNEYHAHRREWLMLNPLPVKIISMDTYDSDRSFLAAVETKHSVDWGEQLVILPYDLSPTAEAQEALEHFIEEHLFYVAELKPAWHLFAFYG